MVGKTQGGISTIGDYAFYNCGTLTTFTSPSLFTLPEHLFNNSDTDSNAKGFRSTIQECKDWIDLNRGRKETYFGDYAGGTVSIICNEDNETVYEEDIL